MLERYFHLKQNQTSPAREVMGGLTTFAAMAYILAVNPAILKDTGMDHAALVTATALAAAVGTALMGLMSNYPIAQAPGMGINVFFTYEICLRMGVAWQGALAMVFWNGVLFLILTMTGLRSQIIRAIPDALKIGMQVGIGLMIVLVGLKNGGVVVSDETTLLRLGEISEGWMPNSATLTALGLLLVVVLSIRKVPGAILIGIVVVTMVGLRVPVGGTGGEGDASLTQLPELWVGLPASLAPLFLELDWSYPFTHWQVVWVPVLTLMFVDLFDSIGTLLGVARRAGFLDEKGELPRMDKALAADATATSLGALLGTSPVTSYIESAAGVEAGARTGLASLVTAGCFLLALFFHPLILSVPAAATAPALIWVGMMMLSGLQSIEWSDLRRTVPAVITMIMIPFGFGISNGIAFGCISYCVVMALTGEVRAVKKMMYGLAAIFALKLILLGV
ncbi:MAG: NCS2 family permease [Verrucomicrobiales bacterium]|nr:NCS2 family permease [Verrucomicrobiales bacterium]